MSYLVSIIVPVYNSAQYLERCLNSLVNQTLKEIQIIVVNDGSTDGSESILKHFAKAYPNVEVIYQHNQGVSVARNTGLAYVKGDYVGFVDSDDYVESIMFETLYDQAVKNDAQITICNYRKTRYTSDFISEQIDITQDSLAETYIKCIAKHPVLWNKLFKYEIIQDLSFDKDMKMGEDLLFNTLAYNRVKRIAVVDTPLYFYDNTSESITRSARRYEYKNMIRSYCNDLKISTDDDLAVYQMLVFVTGFLFSTVMNKRPYTYVANEFAYLANNKRVEIKKFLREKKYAPIYRYDTISRKLYYGYKFIFFCEYIKLRYIAVGMMWVISKLIRMRHPI